MPWPELSLVKADLYLAALAEAGVFCSVSLAVLALVLLRQLRAARLAPLRLKLRARLSQQLIDPHFEPNSLLTEFRGFPPDALLAELAGVATNLLREPRRRVRLLARGFGMVDTSLRACTDRRWWRRLRAVRMLSLLAEGQQVVPRMLEDRNALVRAEAVAWVADHPTPELLSRLVVMLGEASPVTRYTAQDALIRSGGEAVRQPLAAALQIPGPSTVPALEVAARLADPSFLPPALELSRSPQPPVRAAAARLLGALGGEAASARLVELLDDQEPVVRIQACQALGTLVAWDAAGHLVAMLEDDSFACAMAAARSLRAMGSRGEILLRQASRRENRGAALARHVLDLPESLAGGMDS